jgi:hypothetical protein
MTAEKFVAAALLVAFVLDHLASPLSAETAYYSSHTRPGQ